MSKQQSVWATLPPITAGALSTATIMYPMDLLRALKMSSAADGKAAASTSTLIKNFYNTHGLKGFVSQGVGPEMLRATYMRVLKFFLFPITHEALFKKKEAQGSPLTRAIAGGLASLPEGFTIQPIEVSKIVLQLDKEKKYNNSGTAVMKDILKTRGWSGLFVGYFGIQYRQTSWTAVYFGTLNYFTDHTKKVIPKEWVTAQNIVGGFLAGMFGAVFNTPGDVIRSAQQKQVFATPAVPMTPNPVAGVVNFFKMGGNIYAAQGLKGLYFGFGFKAIHLGGSGALLASLIPIFKKLMNVN